jgi:hypothetical protein
MHVVGLFCAGACVTRAVTGGGFSPEGISCVGFSICLFCLLTDRLLSGF